MTAEQVNKFKNSLQRIDTDIMFLQTTREQLTEMFMKEHATLDINTVWTLIPNGVKFTHGNQYETAEMFRAKIVTRDLVTPKSVMFDIVYTAYSTYGAVITFHESDIKKGLLKIE